MKVHNFEQYSPEWFEIRKGKMTASHSQEIGNAGKGLTTYVWQLMANSYSEVDEVHYTNPDIERGLELEKQAKALYSMQNDVKLTDIGFVEASEYFGASPDALIDDDGLLEVKAHNNKKHFMLLVNGEKEIDSKYLWQMNAQILASERSYCIYLSYNPDFKQSLVSFKILPDKEMQTKLKAGIEQGKKMINEIEKKYNQLIK